MLFMRDFSVVGIMNFKSGKFLLKLRQENLYYRKITRYMVFLNDRFCRLNFEDLLNYHCIAVYYKSFRKLIVNAAVKYVNNIIYCS